MTDGPTEVPPSAEARRRGKMELVAATGPAILTSALAVGFLMAGEPLAAAALGGSALLSAVFSMMLRRRVREERTKDELRTRQLLQAQKLAAIGEMASGIAHEINNPLAVIGREAEWIQALLEDAPPLPRQTAAEIRDSLAVIGDQVRRCADITHRLLDFARKREPLRQWVDPIGLVEDMVQLVERVLRGRDIRIRRCYEPGLAAVFTDAPLLRQVVLNLLNNAVQAIEQSMEPSGTITVTIGESLPGWVDMAVEDTGCGIPPENMGRLFDPFFTTKAAGQGTGLGLAVCHKIVTGLGGFILVESKKGCGSRFTVRLPRKPGEGPAL
ncbi:His Kinase A (phospho-acceptor) domain-containing protein [Desulfacinum infernum DSM 9756]|uniref:histidine kinase n=1 Tax=Desulfacinum infernum DSM 9756 TaxID=1121391 RepID=A0A1M5F6B8_9BACT|nr:ATP-binding protein [Desulfacinum infernum]MBC7357209.1 two-component sensor histidine kinase [Desulfacinum sp.]SHF87015.1 His Kinase A (phospho-acceptor) domain-containing protein [Desulfacinum infernum DSM 9756]